MAPPVTPPFDRSAAQAAIRAIIDRQRRATETRDLELALGDLAPALAGTYRPRVVADFRALAELRDITSAVSAIAIDVADSSRAQAKFRDVLTAVRKSNGEKLVLFDGSITYDLTHADGRWVIAGIRTEPQRPGR